MIDPSIIFKIAVKQIGHAKASKVVADALAVQADPDTALIAEVNDSNLQDVSMTRGWYEGKSTQLGEGGKLRVLIDQIMYEDGLDYFQAREVAIQAGISAYGPEQMAKWAKAGKVRTATSPIFHVGG